MNVPLSETLIANTSLVSEGLSKRINLYEYFTTDNATHIICGNESMSKAGDPTYEIRLESDGSYSISRSVSSTKMFALFIAVPH